MPPSGRVLLPAGWFTFLICLNVPSGFMIRPAERVTVPSWLKVPVSGAGGGVTGPVLDPGFGLGPLPVVSGLPGTTTGRPVVVFTKVLVAMTVGAGVMTVLVVPAVSLLSP